MCGDGSLQPCTVRDGLGQCIVVGVADAADERYRASFGDALFESIRTARLDIAVIDQVVRAERLVCLERRFRRFEHEVGSR